MTQMTLQADAEKVRRSLNSTRVASHRTAPQHVSAPATPKRVPPRHAITQVDLTQFRSDPFSAIRRFATLVTSKMRIPHVLYDKQTMLIMNDQLTP